MHRANKRVQTPINSWQLCQVVIEIIKMRKIFYLLFIAIVACFAEAKAPSDQGRSKALKVSLIQKAKNLTLQHDRIQATQVLIRGIRHRLVSQKHKAELMKSLRQLSEVFYSEDGQKLFQLGQSLSSSDVTTAISKYEQATTIEKGNVAILRELARSYLRQGNCKKSLQTSEQAQSYNPYAADIVLIVLQSHACLNEPDKFSEALSFPGVDYEAIKVFVEMSKAQVAHFNGKNLLAKRHLLKAKAIDSGFPEIYYWMGQIKQAEGEDTGQSNRKYVEICQQAQVVRAKYPQEPRVCLEKSKVQRNLEALSEDTKPM
jgi:tetratricopeptide (TPR) repeat protein